MSIEVIMAAVSQMMFRAHQSGLGGKLILLGAKEWMVFCNFMQNEPFSVKSKVGGAVPMLNGLKVRLMKADGVALVTRPIYLDMSDGKS